MSFSLSLLIELYRIETGSRAEPQAAVCLLIELYRIETNNQVSFEKDGVDF